MSQRNRIPVPRQGEPSVAGGILQRRRAPAETQGPVEEALRSAGRPLATDVRGFMEQRIGHDFSRVRVHTGEPAARSAQAVDALAYTVGSDVVFGAGQYAPETPAGRRLIAHELTHVVQQSGRGGEAAGPGAGGGPAEGEAEGVARAVEGGSLAVPRPGTVPAGLQRAPAKETSRETFDPLPSRGAPLPYREATELADCARIMGKDSETYCREQVLGKELPSYTLEDHKAAMKREHEKQQERVAGLLQKGLAQKPATASATDPQALFRNSCEWIVQGKSSLVVLTRTHDSETRIPTKLAYFDKQVKFPQTGGDYQLRRDVSDGDHIAYFDPGYEGGMGPDGLSLVDPGSKTDEKLRTVIVHEVQHAAEQNAGNEAGRVQGSPGLKGSDALISGQRHNDYQSEFRAFWIENPEGSPQDRFGSSRAPARNGRAVAWTDPGSQQERKVKTEFRNARQENIFWYLHDAYPGLEVASTYVTDPGYRAMVNSFENPVGVNLVNSVRIQNLIKAIESLAAAQGAGSQGAARLLFLRVADLDATDRAFLEDPAGSQAFWKFAERSLPTDVFYRLHRMFRRDPVGDFPPDPSWKPQADHALA